MGNIIQSIPEAKLLLASLRSVGYTEETAIADIVDNCISAKAKHIDIIFETEKMRILILDDGIGMTAQALIENMRIGSSDPSKQRDDTDLGRFGMGMKTAAFSLGKRLTVVTRIEETTSNAAWDLDKIPDIGWNLIIEESDSIAEISSRLGAQGTVVCIENLDRVIGSLDEAKAKKKFYKTAEKVEKHLALIFHRFIEEDGLVIRINGTEIQPWNPFVINNNATQELADETIWSDDGASEVVIQPYVLPHRTKFASDDDYQAAGGAKGWNYHQGVYVYRNRKKKLLKRAERYLTIAENDHVFAEAKTAFQAVVDFYEGRLAIDRIKDKIEPSIMIQRMLSKAQEIFENNIVVDKYVQDNGLAAQIRSFAVYDYLKKILEAPENDYVIYSDVLCAADYGAPQKRMRFVVIGIKRSISAKIALPKGHFDADEYRTVRDAISDLEDVKPVIDLADDQNGIVLQPKENLSELASSLRNSLILRNHMVTKTTDTAMERFRALKQGQNFHSLKDSMKTNTYTDAARTQNTIYLRLNYDEPSGTVVNVRKSMWIHPTQDRAISVREAARLQTFPDSFVFCGSKDKQYQQVGNAVPPIMAKSIAEKLAQILEKNLAGRERNG